MQKGQAAEATPTAAGAAPELSIMRAPAAPSSLSPSPPRLGAAASRAGSSGPLGPRAGSPHLRKLADAQAWPCPSSPPPAPPAPLPGAVTSGPLGLGKGGGGEESKPEVGFALAHEQSPPSDRKSLAPPTSAGGSASWALFCLLSRSLGGGEFHPKCR